MFIHAVLFEIKPGEVAKYRKDSLMWARFARRAAGFRSYQTMKCLNHKNQYFSIYVWDNKVSHDRFMGKLHDWLVSKSKAKVKVLSYHNLKKLDRVVKQMV